MGPQGQVSFNWQHSDNDWNNWMTNGWSGQWDDQWMTNNWRSGNWDKNWMNFENGNYWCNEWDPDCHYHNNWMSTNWNGNWNSNWNGNWMSGNRWYGDSWNGNSFWGQPRWMRQSGMYRYGNDWNYPQRHSYQYSLDW